MTKLEIVKKVMEETNQDIHTAKEAVELILQTIKEALASGDEVILRRFGTFSVVKKKKRVGRNPKTGEPAPIPARKVVRFKAGKYFKDALLG